jgi:hypothetical protein
MQTPVITNQIIDLLHQEELVRQEFLRTEPFEFVFTRDNGERVLKDRTGSQILEGEIAGFVPKTKEQLRAEFMERLSEVISFTPIDFVSESQPTSERMTINWENSYDNKKLTTRQMSMAEAHEKGHMLRPYGGAFFANYFAPAFDQNKVQFTDEDYAAHSLEGKKSYANFARVHPDILHGEDSDLSTAEMRKEYLANYLFTGSEIVERMAQIKNYFGMQGADEFTKDHLAYAREHYLEDVGLDNGITHFFQAITPETEGKFLELVNSSGV